MKECFNTVKTKMLEGLSAQGYQLLSENTAGSRMTAVLANDEEKLMLEYDKNLFALYRGAADADEVDLAKSQTYLFDKAAGDGVREAAGVANEFLETLQKKAGAGIAAAPQQRKRSKDKNSDENDVIFFINRVVTVMPECRTPLTQHKNHYEQLLPRKFCDEVIVAAQKDLMKSGEKARIAEYFQLLDTMYSKGDLDTRSVIMQVLLAAVDSRDYDRVEKYFSDDNRKAWAAARKFYGKKVRPEQKSAMAKMASYQAETLNGRR